ncbi:hypothetical protein JCM5353_007928 [Sporobolomyces roseus]
MPKYQEPIRTREQAAARLLDLSGYLSSSTFIHRPFDRTLMKPVVGDLQTIMERLPELGYEADSSAHELVSLALSTLSAPLPSGFASFSTLITTSKLLLDAALSLSTSASPFPLSNQHLPNEILYLILDYVRSDIKARRRRDTLHTLIATSIHWRRIALPASQSQLIITSYSELERCLSRWAYCRLSPPTNTVELVHIDLSDEYDRNLEPNSSWKIHPSIKVRQLTLDLTMDGNHYIEDWYEWARNRLEKVGSYTLKLPGSDQEEFRSAATAFFGEEFAYGYERAELYVGEQPILTTISLVQERLDHIFEDEYYGISSLPRFMDYSVLSTPWLTFTVPIFLLEPFIAELLPEDDELYMPPSRLEHLEISLELDPSDPVEALRQVDVFFETISPKLERLALRLRLTSPHPSALNETTFTDHFIDGLLSCSKLNHLELGGFGLSPDYLSRLIRLPLTTLIVLPILPLPSLDDLEILLVDTPDLATSGLEEFCVQKIAGQMGQEEYKMLQLAYEAVGITLRTDNRWQRGWQPVGYRIEDDYDIMMKLAEEAGVV